MSVLFVGGKYAWQCQFSIRGRFYITVVHIYFVKIIKFSCQNFCFVLSSLSKRRSGGMADATDSKSVVGDNVRVQVPPSAPNILYKKSFLEKTFFIVKKTICRGFHYFITAYRYDIFWDLKFGDFKSFFKMQKFCCRAESERHECFFWFFIKKLAVAKSKWKNQNRTPK